jgi:hypothetical protein
MKADATLRIARPTDRLEAIAQMYATGLGFTVLVQFHDHDGFDGVILDIRSIPTIWSSPHNVDTRWGKHLRKTISWSFTYPIRTSGKLVVPGC